MIHYPAFAARRASSAPLLGAVAGLAAIARCLGNPQSGVGVAPAAQIPVANSAPGRPASDGDTSDAGTCSMHSPEHRANIRGSDYRQVGIGTAIDGDKMYISAVFADEFAPSGGELAGETLAEAAQECADGRLPEM